MTPRGCSARRLAATAAGTLAALAAGAPMATAGGVPAHAAGVKLPRFIHRGLVLKYGEDIDDGYTGGLATTTVTSRSNTVVHGSTKLRSVGTDKTYLWSCSASGHCSTGDAGFQFWVDPSDVAGSLAGQHLAFANDGTMNFTDPDNHRRYRVGVLHYQNPSGSFEITLYYRKSSGLIVESDNRAGEVTTDLSYIS
jgi:hypothetical protein